MCIRDSYNESWVGEYVFLTIVGDANDLESRVAADNGTMEAHGSMVLTMQKSLR